MGLDMSIEKYEGSFNELFEKNTEEEIFTLSAVNWVIENEKIELQKPSDMLDENNKVKAEYIDLYADQYKEDYVKKIKSELNSIVFNGDKDSLSDLIKKNPKEVAYWRKEHGLNKVILKEIGKKSFDTNAVKLLLTKETVEKIFKETGKSEFSNLLKEDFEKNTFFYTEWY